MSAIFARDYFGDYDGKYKVTIYTKDGSKQTFINVLSFIYNDAVFAFHQENKAEFFRIPRLERWTVTKQKEKDK